MTEQEHEQAQWIAALTRLLGQRRSAQKLLGEAGSLGRAMATPGHVLRSHYGVSASRAAAWEAWRALRQEAARQNAPQESPLSDPARVQRALLPLFALRRREAFFVLPLDAQLNLLRAPILLEEGQADCVVVEPRRVFEALLREDAPTAILAHNHPSGNPEPSWQDRAVTQRLKRVGLDLGVRLVDHLVVAGARAYSIEHDVLLEPPGTAQPALDEPPLLTESLASLDLGAPAHEQPRRDRTQRR